MATSCLSGDEVEQRSTSLERSSRHSLGEDNFVDLEDNLVDLEDYHVDVKHVQLRHSMRIMQERHGGRGKRCFFQILQLKRFKRVKRKRAGRLEPVNHLRQKPGSSSLLPATIQDGQGTTLAEGGDIFFLPTRPLKDICKTFSSETILSFREVLLLLLLMDQLLLG